MLNSVFLWHMSHRHIRQNVDKYKILQMWWGRKRRRKKVEHCNIRIIDRPLFRGEEIQRTLSCVFSTQLFPLCWSLSFFQNNTPNTSSESEQKWMCVTGITCTTVWGYFFNLWYVIKVTFVLVRNVSVILEFVSTSSVLLEILYMAFFCFHFPLWKY